MPRRALFPVLVIVAFLVGGAVGWLVGGSGDGDTQDSLQARLTSVRALPDLGTRYTQAWSDGRAGLRLDPAASGMQLTDPVGVQNDDPDATVQAIRSAAPVAPAALAALPGSHGAAWVAVGLPYDPSADDPNQLARPRAWSVDGRDDPRGGDVPPAAELPIDITTKRSDGAIPTVDAAVAELGGKPVALVTGWQKSISEDKLPVNAGARCDGLGDCRWRSAKLPEGGRVLGVASTGQGFVVITGDPDDTARGSIWYADSPALKWREIGLTPGRTPLAVAQSGRGAVQLVWRTPDTVAIQTVDAGGRVHSAVPALPVPEHLGTVNAVTRVSGNWIVGGSFAGTTEDIALDYAARRPAILVRDGDRWQARSARVLDDQADQEVMTLLDPPSSTTDGVGMTTSSAVGRVEDVWTLEPPD